ncbi:MAG: DUF362 domain-containing protein [Treponema sp.]|nr:DUF362 domain-containing protein [Treponema sp.]MCL2251141.1 DUF362 domain-containing protein [Treponema sp.]
MITINYGKDYTKTTSDTLAASDIKIYLQKDFSVSIKPNLVVERPASGGATTHPEVIEGIILFLKDFGIKNIKIIENSACGHNTKMAFKACGYEILHKKYGVALIDLKDDNFISLKHDGIDYKISELALKSDFLINVPVLKAHCQTKMTCCMKNLKGCMPQSEMRRFHALGLNKPIAGLNFLLKTHFCVADGICGDLSFEEGGTPVEANRIITGQNPLFVDSYCAQLIGYNPDDIGYLSYGKKLGIGEYFSQKTKVTELNADQKPVCQIKSDRIADKYRSLIEEDCACSVCYASLIFALHRKGGIISGKKICIGQGFKGKSGGCLGIGNCTKGFKKYVKGCPPKAADILAFL